MHRSTWLTLAIVAVLAAIIVAIFILTGDNLQADGGVRLKLRIGDGLRQAILTRNADGTYAYRVLNDDGASVALTPHEFSHVIYEQELGAGFLARVLNISSPAGIAWVAVGLLGQLLFTGRMVVQWLVSEKHRRSIVPPAFWWFSIIGAVMLLSYFLWRRDLVGVLGQGAGLVIYLRNLYFIYLTRPREEASGDLSA